MNRIFSSVCGIIIFCVLFSEISWFSLSALGVLSDFNRGILMSFALPTILSGFVSYIILGYKKDVERKNKELKALNKLNNKLFSVIAHDIKSPINQTRTLLDTFLISPMTKSELDVHINDISNRTDGLLNFIDDILHWAKYQMESQGKMKIDNFHTEDVIEQIIDLYQLEIEKKDILIKMNDVDIYAQTDKEIYSLILRNLIQNAIKFTPKGGEVSVRVLQDGDVFETFIGDSGMGMRKETVDELFRKGEVHSELGTNEEHGNGFGLKMCFKYAKVLNGDIRVESAEGVGSVFSLQIPNMQ